MPMLGINFRKYWLNASDRGCVPSFRSTFVTISGFCIAAGKFGVERFSFNSESGAYLYRQFGPPSTMVPTKGTRIGSDTKWEIACNIRTEFLCSPIYLPPQNALTALRLRS